MSNEYHSTGYDYGQGPKHQAPRPAPTPQKCETGKCKDGGVAPFYTLYEKDGGGWRTGRKMVICHTCYYGGVRPQFRGDAIPISPIPSGSLHVTGPEEDEEPRPTIEQLDEHSRRLLQAQATQPSLHNTMVEDMSKHTVAQPSYSAGVPGMNIIIESPTKVKAEVTATHDEKMVATYSDDQRSIELPPVRSSERSNVSHEEKHENTHSTLPGKRRTTRGKSDK